LKKGDLKFTLDGYKLKGSWVLVRTGGRWGASSGGDRSWLLIKHRDDWAGDVDITAFAPKSVKSDGEFEDILAADRPDVWESNRPARGGETGKMFERIIERTTVLSDGIWFGTPQNLAKEWSSKALAAQIPAMLVILL
jgi:hypothetical protein